MKEKIKVNYFRILVRAIISGFIIGVAATTYLTVENKYIGAFLFTFGLFSIYTLEYKLYTGKIGFFLEDKNVFKMAVIWVGNLIGTIIMGYLVMATRLVTTTGIITRAREYAEIKLADNYLSTFILGCLCGFMMFVAAKAYKQTQNTVNSIGGYIGLFLCVMVFLIGGFEHSVANMFYYTVAEVWSLHTLIMVLIVTAGNTVGALWVPVMTVFYKSKIFT